MQRGIHPWIAIAITAEERPTGAQQAGRERCQDMDSVTLAL